MSPTDPATQVEAGPAREEAAVCCYCGEDENVEILEVWGHEFAFDTCCEGMYEEVVAFLNDEPSLAKCWMREKLLGLLPGGPRLRRVADDGVGTFVLDFNLQLVEVSFDEMATFVSQHHEHCEAPIGWRFGIGVFNGSSDRSYGTLVGVASVGRPVARMIDQQRIVEINRVCIDRSAPKPLVFNAASMMYGFAAREAKARGFERILTYTTEEECGTSLVAAGYVPDHFTRGRRQAWRNKAAVQTLSKVRWSKQLVKKPKSSLPGNASTTGKSSISRILSGRSENLASAVDCGFTRRAKKGNFGDSGSLHAGSITQKTSTLAETI